MEVANLTHLSMKRADILTAKRKSRQLAALLDSFEINQQERPVPEGHEARVNLGSLLPSSGLKDLSF